MAKKLNYPGLPAPVVEFMSGLKKPDSIYRARAERFKAHAFSSFENEERLAKDWAAITKHAVAATARQDGVVAVFIGLPDRAALNPTPSLNGRPGMNATTIRQEQKRYAKYLAAVNTLQDLRHSQITAEGKTFVKRYERYEELIHDALLRPEPEAPGSDQEDTGPQLVELIKTFRLIDTAFFDGLDILAKILPNVRPERKTPAKQYRSKDAAHTVYVQQIAELNRHLNQPQHAALASLANINNPDRTVTRDEIRKAWGRGQISS